MTGVLPECSFFKADFLVNSIDYPSHHFEGDTLLNLGKVISSCHFALKYGAFLPFYKVNFR